MVVVVGFFFFFFKFIYFYHPSFITSYSIFVTYHLKYSNFLISTHLAIVFTSHHLIISTVLQDPHTDPKKTFFFSFPFVFLCLPWTFLCFSFGLFLAKQSKNLHISLARIASIDGPHCLKVSYLNWRGLFIAKPNRILFVSCIDRWTGFETTCSLTIVDSFPRWPLIGGFGGAMGLWCCCWSVADGFEFAFLFLFLMIEKSRFFFFFWRLFELKSLCVLFELKSLFLDFGRMEKMVGLS